MENRKVYFHDIGKDHLLSSAVDPFGFIILGLALEKDRDCETHKASVGCLQTYFQTSLGMFCFKSLHRRKKIQGKSCSRALGYRWFQRISQRPSEQAKADEFESGIC